MNKQLIEPSTFQKIIFNKIINNNKTKKCYEKAKIERENNYNLDDIKKIINNSPLEELYLEQMENFNTDILYKSEGHGINHNIRVCFFAYIISTKENISEEDFKLIMEACKYHDIGRINDLEDALHGKRSADSLSFLMENYTVEELNYIKTIITCHSLSDREFERIAIKNNISDLKRCKKLYEILKDSDGLDRVRLCYPYVNIKYLRTETAKNMIPFAHELFYNYNLFLEKDKQKTRFKIMK